MYNTHYLLARAKETCNIAPINFSITSFLRVGEWMFGLQVELESSKNKWVIFSIILQQRHKSRCIVYLNFMHK